MTARPTVLGVVITCTLAIAIGGCATTGEPSATGAAQTTADQPKQCNPILIGLAAAAVCGITTKDAGWAAGCAALAAAGCVALNSYRVKQAKTAEQVAEEYSRSQGSLPEIPTLTGYTATLTPGGVIPRGQKLDANVEMTVVPSRDGGPVLIEDEWALYDAKGEKWWGPVRKPFNQADQQAGAYVGGFSFTVPKELPQGNYEFRSRVYLNGTEVKSNTNPIQVAVLAKDDPRQVLVARR